MLAHPRNLLFPDVACVEIYSVGLVCCSCIVVDADGFGVVQVASSLVDAQFVSALDTSLPRSIVKVVLLALSGPRVEKHAD